MTRIAYKLPLSIILRSCQTNSATRACPVRSRSRNSDVLAVLGECGTIWFHPTFLVVLSNPLSFFTASSSSSLRLLAFALSRRPSLFILLTRTLSISLFLLTRSRPSWCFELSSIVTTSNSLPPTTLQHVCHIRPEGDLFLP
jgi:hypothetical protein